MNSFDNQGNIFVNNLSRNDLKEFLMLLNAWGGGYLNYRNSLNIPINVTFGIEIEYLGANPRMVDFYVDEIMREWYFLCDWESKRELNLPGGGEVVSPIMTDNKNTWNEIKNICQFLKNNKSLVTLSAGGHIHVGASILTCDYNVWRRFFKLYTIFEDVLYRFCYGDKINGRENIQFFAKPIGDILLFKMSQLNRGRKLSDIKDFYPCDTREYGLNLKNVNFDDITDKIGNTIEFRFPNATIEEVIWQNNINVLVKLLLAALNSNLDENFLDYLLEDMDEQAYTGNMVYDYKNINFRKALLFVDLVFDNTVDKIYFLKQYFKNFQNTQEKDLVLARRFII